MHLSTRTTGRAWPAALAAASLVAACGGRPVAVTGTGGDSVTGVALHRDAPPWPADAELEIWLQDDSAAPGEASDISRGTVRVEGRQPPLPFALRYDGDRIDDDHTYVVHAALRSGGRILYATQADTLVITRGHSDDGVTLVLMPVGAPAAPPSAPVTGLVGTSWRLEDLGGAPVIPAADATLDFPEATRATGNGSCNQFSGSVTLTDTSITFGPLTTTRMACADDVMAQEGQYLKALAAAERFAFDGPALQIFSKGLAAPLRFVRRPAAAF